MARIVDIRGAASLTNELGRFAIVPELGACKGAGSDLYVLSIPSNERRAPGYLTPENASYQQGEQMSFGLEQLYRLDLSPTAYDNDPGGRASPPLSSDDMDDGQLRRVVLQSLLTPNHPLSKATAAAYAAPCIEPTSILHDDSVPCASLIRSLPTYILYDDEGLRLFDQITHLPEYYPTNAELDILQRHGQDIVAEAMPDGALAIELGAGSMRKVSPLLDAVRVQGKSICYCALDLCEGPLREALEPMADRYSDRVDFIGLLGTYDDGMAAFNSINQQQKQHAATAAAAAAPRCWMWLGSSVGNYTRTDAAAFLKKLRETAMQPGDLLLVGIDYRNEPGSISLAYNDPGGVTRNFIMNGLCHADRILGGGRLPREDFEYACRYDPVVGRHEAYYRAKKAITLTNLPPLEQDGADDMQKHSSSSSSSSTEGDTGAEQANPVLPSESCPSPCPSSEAEEQLPPPPAAAAADDDDDDDDGGDDGCCYAADDDDENDVSTPTKAPLSALGTVAATAPPAATTAAPPTTSSSTLSRQSSSSSSSGIATAVHLSHVLQLQAGELIHIEYSYKYSKQEIQDLCTAAGLRVRQYWQDSKQQYGLYLMAIAAEEGEKTAQGTSQGLGNGGDLGFSGGDFGAGSAGGFGVNGSGNADLGGSGNEHQQQQQQEEQQGNKSTGAAAAAGRGGGEDAATERMRRSGASVPCWADWQQLWRLWDAATLSMVPPGGHLDQPISLRHPFIFYVGHTPAFVERRLEDVVPGWEAVQPEQYTYIFSRGIDPDVDDPSKCHSHPEVPPEWPSLEAVLQYRDTIRHQMEQLYCQYRLPTTTTTTTTSSSSSSEELLPLLPAEIQEVLWMGYEHEAMHLETLMYMMVQYEHVLPPPPALQGCYSTTISSTSSSKRAGGGSGARDGGLLGSSWGGGLAAPPKPWLVEVPGGKVTKGFNGTLSSSSETGGAGVVGQQGLGFGFGWDNEQPEQELEVLGFSMQYRAVTVGEYCWFLAQEALQQQQQGKGQAGNGEERATGSSSSSSSSSLASSSSSSSSAAAAVEVRSMLHPDGQLYKLLPASWKLLPATESHRSNINGSSSSSSSSCSKDSTTAAAAAAGLLEVVSKMLAVRSVYGAVPLLEAWLWPVYTSGLQAEDYAAAAGMRLPTEGELLRAWQWQKQQEEHGAVAAAAATTATASGAATAAARSATASAASAAAPSTAAAAGGIAFATWHPVEVDLWPEGGSAHISTTSSTRNGSSSGNGSSSSSTNSGGGGSSYFSQLRTNGWEWSSTVFDRHSGFMPDPKYPEYSRDFFDGKHAVMLGGSWATAPQIAERQTFRNWYQPGYPYAFAKFRLCARV